MPALRIGLFVTSFVVLSSLSVAQTHSLRGSDLNGSVGKTLYSFQGYPNDGEFPIASLISDNSGVLYGTTFEGGIGNGTVFQLTPPTPPEEDWQETLLYKFDSTQFQYEGAHPEMSVVLDNAGNLYGTTYFGGYLEFGTVFELSPPTVEGQPWTETQLYIFQGENDGNYPYSPLLFDRHGNLYGTTNSSGGYFGGGGSGVLFKLTPPSVAGGSWTDSTPYTFLGSPGGNQVLDAHGQLYGAGEMIGGGQGGGVYQVTAPQTAGGQWTGKTLYSFQGGTDAFFPVGGVVAGKGASLYGATYEGGFSLCKNGCGTVYQLTPPATSDGSWKETVIHFFTGGADGTMPLSGLVADSDGNLYGTTSAGGVYGFGTVYKLIPPRQQGGVWQETIIHSFQSGSDGANPAGGLLLRNGIIYGTTEYGGAYNYGTVFAFKQ
jgi:uncharacterized repeat protein (TIGR03803 family)